MLGAPYRKIIDRAAIVLMDNPSTNSITASVRLRLRTLITRIIQDCEADFIVLKGAGEAFSAGTDIACFSDNACRDSELPELIRAIKESPIPVLAAIEGYAYGEALSLALACHARIAHPDARLGFNETALGLIPVGGVTFTLPRLIGLHAALEMIAGGKMVTGIEALSLGIVDATSHFKETLESAAIRFGREWAASPDRLTRTVMWDRSRYGDEEAIQLFRAGFPAALKQLAPAKAMECVLASSEGPFELSLAAEARCNADLINLPDASALLHARSVELDATSGPAIGTRSSAQTVAVVGFGFMGRGIALSFARGGLKVLVYDASKAGIRQGFENIDSSLASMVRRRRLSSAEAEFTRNNIIEARSIDELSEVDIVVEAASEDITIKKAIFSSLDKACKGATILATNTSALNIDEIASVTRRPDRVAGMHFFSPAHLLKLVEIVIGKLTSEETIQYIRNVTNHIDKIGVVVGNEFAFVGNRLLAGYQREAIFLLEEGALPEQVDRVIQDFGFAMGPFVMNDMAGNDISYDVRKAANYPDGMRYPHVADRLVEAGRHGQKVGKGWYKYNPGDRTPYPDPELADLVQATSLELGIKRRTISDDEILQRCILPVINDGVRLLGNGVARCSGDIDAIWLNGLGFPRSKGGPMFWADKLGSAQVYKLVTDLCEKFGPLLWEPAPMLATLSKRGMRFADL